MTQPSKQEGNFMALDVGTVRVGVAVASHIARLPYPHATLENDDSLWSGLQDICQAESIGTVIVGLPRSLSGDDTSQTAYCRSFAEEASEKLGLQVVLQDEALTSVKAEAELKASRKPRQPGDVDALAATYILEDYLTGVT
jgi:putative Holliday junction resolvase